MRAAAIGKEANKQDGKQEIQQIDDEIARLVRMGTSLVRERKEGMAASGVSDKSEWELLLSGKGRKEWQHLGQGILRARDLQE